MEQWIYMKLYESVMDIMEKANEEFFCEKDLIYGTKEEDMCDVCCVLNKASFVIRKAIEGAERG